MASLTQWLTPAGDLRGIFRRGVCAYLAAVYPTREAALQGDVGLRDGAEIISGFISACIMASVPEHF